MKQADIFSSDSCLFYRFFYFEQKKDYLLQSVSSSPLIYPLPAFCAARNWRNISTIKQNYNNNYRELFGKNSHDKWCKLGKSHLYTVQIKLRNFSSSATSEPWRVCSDVAGVGHCETACCDWSEFACDNLIGLLFTYLERQTHLVFCLLILLMLLMGSQDGPVGWSLAP